VKNFFKRTSKETLGENALLQEIDERHFIAEQVFHRRERAGWSQEELAAECRMTQAQVALIEAGQANPTLRSLVKLANALGCSVSELSASTDPSDDEATELLVHADEARTVAYP
jgi:transcriptional regulator with XRE-family HTH domain